MGHVSKTPAGRFRANWRDATGRQKAKTFKTKKEANAFLASTEASINAGSYVDPHAGRVRFGEHAARWLASREKSARTNERTRSIMQAHVLPRWADWPLSRIDHMSVQEWATGLGRHLAPATVKKCLTVFSLVMRSAVRMRLIANDPSEGVQTASAYRTRAELRTVTRQDFFGRLLPAVSAEHQALVCAAAGTGLRWGELVGLAWSAVDLAGARLRVVQVIEETAYALRVKPFPKSRAGVRSVPLPDFVVAQLRALRARAVEEPQPDDLVFTTSTGTPPRRSNFRRQVWRPALVRAGMLGSLVEKEPALFVARWLDGDGVEWSAQFGTEREAVVHLVDHAAGGLRFHDLRHSYATWLVSDGVPVNVVQRVMGHQNASTTLNLYTHAPDDYEGKVRRVFPTLTDDPLTFDLQDGSSELDPSRDDDDDQEE